MHWKKLITWLPSGIAALIGRFCPDVLNQFAKSQKEFGFLVDNNVYLLFGTLPFVLTGFYITSIFFGFISNRLDDEISKKRKLRGFWFETYNKGADPCIGIFQIRLDNTNKLILSGYSFFKNKKTAEINHGESLCPEGEWRSIYLEREREDSYTYVFRGKHAGFHEDPTPLSGVLNFAVACDSGYGHFYESHEVDLNKERIFKKIEINFERLDIDKYSDGPKLFGFFPQKASNYYLSKPLPKVVFAGIAEKYIRPSAKSGD